LPLGPSQGNYRWPLNLLPHTVMRSTAVLIVAPIVPLDRAQDIDSDIRPVTTITTTARLTLSFVHALQIPFIGAVGRAPTVEVGHRCRSSTDSRSSTDKSPSSSLSVEPPDLLCPSSMLSKFPSSSLSVEVIIGTKSKHQVHTSQSAHTNHKVTAGTRLAWPSMWARLLSRSSFLDPCLPSTALATRVTRSTTLCAGHLSLLFAILARMCWCSRRPTAAILCTGSSGAGDRRCSPAAILAPAPDALVLAEGRPAAILAPAPLALVLADAPPAAILARALAASRKPNWTKFLLKGLSEGDTLIEFVTGP
jgi:hypothetical protein